MSELQDEVSQFIESNGLRTDPEYRLLDLVSEVGELSKDANEFTDYGTHPDRLEISDIEAEFTTPYGTVSTPNYTTLHSTAHGTIL